jgi:hypothetical protein
VAVHFSQLSGRNTAPGMFIANIVDDGRPACPSRRSRRRRRRKPPPPLHNGTACWIKVSAQTSGTFTVTNARNGFSKTYDGRSPERDKVHRLACHIMKHKGSVTSAAGGCSIVVGALGPKIPRGLVGRSRSRSRCSSSSATV